MPKLNGLFPGTFQNQLALPFHPGRVLKMNEIEREKLIALLEMLESIGNFLNIYIDEITQELDQDGD